MSGNEGIQRGYRRCDLAEFQRQLGTVLHRRQPQLVEPDRLWPGEVAVSELGVSRTAPQRERLIEKRRGPSGGRLGCLSAQRFEPIRVEPTRSRVDAVAGWPGTQHPLAQR